jgi:nucleotide-binding universal stress UspA family protein
LTLVVRPGSLLDRRRSRPAPSEVTIRRIVLASEGRPIPQSVLREVVALAKPEHAEVKVVAIARIWGTSLGFPNPGLQPTRGEWDEQRLSVRKAIEALERSGLEASGHVIATRRAAKRILRAARAFDADAIVMGTDPHRRWIGDFMWSQEPHRIDRRSTIPVHLVPLSEQESRGREKTTRKRRGGRKGR